MRGVVELGQLTKTTGALAVAVSLTRAQQEDVDELQDLESMAKLVIHMQGGIFETCLMRHTFDACLLTRAGSYR
jgi:hypothetical protein